MAVACLKLNPLMACSASNFMLTFLKSRTFPIEEEEEKKPTELNITAGEKKKKITYFTRRLVDIY